MKHSLLPNVFSPLIFCNYYATEFQKMYGEKLAQLKIIR